MLQYIEKVGDKLFREYSEGRDFNSFINESDRAANEQDKEKVAKELKDINSCIEHYPQMEDDFIECKCKLFDIINAVDYFIDEYSKK